MDKWQRVILIILKQELFIMLILKVKIANLAAEALSSAQSDMNAKFIDPIKNS